MKYKTIMGLVLGGVLALLATSASASYSWTFTRTACSGQLSAGSDLYASCTSTGTPASAPDATVTAVGGTGTSGALEYGYVGAYSADPLSLGVVNKKESGSAPNHSMDNEGYYDSLVLTFQQAVKLSSLRLGWMQTDSDLTVMAYTGSGSPVLAGKTYPSLTASGWSLVGHYQNVGTAYDVAINAANYTSSYWMIGAYNPLVGGVPSWADNKLDYVKLKSVTGDAVVNKTPEPSSLLLLGGVGLGLLVSRLRKTA